MGKAVQKLRARHLVILLAIFSILGITYGGILYWQGSKQIEQSEIGQVSGQQLVLAKAGALAIGEYFHNKELSLLTLAAIFSETTNEGMRLSALERAVEQLKDVNCLIDVVGITDSEGSLTEGIEVDSGEEYDQAELVRFLSEMIWFPSAFLSDYIRWEPIGTDSVKATIQVNNLSASAVLHFNPEGQITNLVAERYMDVSGGMILKKWSTPLHKYEEINGIMVPVKGEGVWRLSTGDFSYVKIAGIPELEYNNPNVF